MVLFPFGAAQDERARQIYDEMLIRHCGADVDRFIDKAMTSLDEYADFIGRFTDVSGVGRPPIIVIARVVSVALNVVRLRDDLTKRFPALERSLWILCADPVVDAFFESETQSLGRLNDEIDNAPVWQDDRSGARYLILTPRTRHLPVISERVIKLTSSSDATPSRRRPSSTMLRAAVRPFRKP